jgi:hypothetical protein
MKIIKYNKYIDRIGIEFEGMFMPALDQYFNNAGRPAWVGEYGTDGSVGSDSYKKSDGCNARELRSQPLTEKLLNQALENMFAFEQSGAYIVNSRCGLHHHFSFSNNGFGSLVDKVFYDDYCAMFHKNFYKVYANRRRNHYSKEKYASIERHFKYQSDHRYQFVNYCWNKHRTIEFRGYGGRFATLTGLSEIIQRTIDLVGNHIDKYKARFAHIIYALPAPKNANHVEIVMDVKKDQPPQTIVLPCSVQPPQQLSDFIFPMENPLKISDTSNHV